MVQMLREQAHALKILAAHSEVASLICGAVADDKLGRILNVHTLCTQSRLARGRAGGGRTLSGGRRVPRSDAENQRAVLEIANQALMASLVPTFQAIMS